MVVSGKKLLPETWLETGGEFSHKYIYMVWFSKNSMYPVKRMLLYLSLLMLNNSKT